MAMDAIEMLTQQHREVDELFERIERSDGDERIQLIGRVCERLTLHTQIEERHFYPFAQSAGIQDLVDHSLEEHGEAKQLISQLLQLKRNDPRVVQLCGQLKDSVQHHVKEEENTFFPRLKSLASVDDLRAVADEMQRTMDELSKQELLKMAEHEGAAQQP